MSEGTVTRHTIKGRSATLTPNLVLDIMELREKGWGASRIGKKLGLPRGAVNSVLRGASWSYITGINPNDSRRVDPYRLFLDEETVRMIMELSRIPGISDSVIAVVVGLGRSRASTVCAIRNGWAWNSVTGLPKRRKGAA